MDAEQTWRQAEDENTSPEILAKLAKSSKKNISYTEKRSLYKCPREGCSKRKNNAQNYRRISRRYSYNT
ncbi:MAG: hypothetical protein AAF383_18850 [Cyanobacteria bacterium P01_A01_bin.83]